jgi:uncharacterized Zn finger protein
MSPITYAVTTEHVRRLGAAYDRADVELIEARNIMSMSSGSIRVVRAEVNSSSCDRNYVVMIETTSEEVRYGCTCEAGRRAIVCKHVAATLMRIAS